MDNFVQLLKQGNVHKFEEEYLKLPISTVPSNLIKQSTQSANREESSDSDSSDNVPQQNPIPMEEDSEWTTVKTKRRR